MYYYMYYLIDVSQSTSLGGGIYLSDADRTYFNAKQI